MKAFATYQTKRNNEKVYHKPNEDFVLADNEHQIYIVADGVTRDVMDGNYPDPSPAAIVSELFVNITHQELLQNNSSQTPEEALLKSVSTANEAIANFNAGNFKKIDYLENNLAGTVALVSLIQNNTFHFIHVGDCYGFLISHSVITQFTQPQTELLRINRAALGTGKENKIYIRRDICNTKNHPYGYGVYTGSPDVLNFIEYGEIPLKGDETIILVTDGLELLHTNKELLIELAEKGPQSLIAQMEQMEVLDSRIRSDDKSAIVIKVIH